MYKRQVYEWKNKEKIVYSKEIKGVSLNKGMNELKIPISADVYKRQGRT